MSTSLSIDGSSVRITGSSGRKIDKWNSVSFDPDFLREGTIFNTTEMAKIIKQALAEAKLSTKHIRCSLPSINSVSRILTLPQIRRSDLEVTIQREARRVMSVSPETNFLQWQLLPNGGTEQQVFVLAIPQEPLQRLMQTCQIVGVTIDTIDLIPLALARAVNQKNAIIAHGEVNAIEMVIIVNSLPGLMRGTWLRENSLDTDKATALLLQQIASTIEYYNDMNRTNPLPTNVPIYLTGEVALNPELAQRVSTISGRAVANLEPPVTYPAEFPVAQYMTNIGLILKSS